MVPVSVATLLSVFMISFSVCVLTVLTKRYHIVKSAGGGVQNAVQAAHRTPTPRIGGIGIVLAVLFGLLIIMPGENGARWNLFALSLTPIFIAGLAEDLGFGISPRGRLLAAALSGAICVTLLGLWIPRADIPFVDGLFLTAPVAIAFTIFVATGVCHAFNLIDGVNGLAAGVGVVGSVGLAAIAAQAGQSGVMTAALLMIPALLGFLALNYPFGKLFLGDAGAYSIGHVLAWLAIVLLAEVNTLTPWAILLVLFWPVADTALAIYRRRRSGKPADQPDRLHFHQLVMRALEIGYFGRDRRHLTNPMTALIILPLASIPMVTGVLLWDKPLAAFLAWLVFGALFFATYNVGIRYASTSRRQVNSILTRRADGQRTATAAE